MPTGRERSPREQETLIFATPEAAQEWQEHVGEQLRKEQPQPGVHQEREVVGEALAKQFAAEGEGVASIKEPWLHTPAEHQEAQELVDVAFARDLSTALKTARRSPHYPRNLDLFHDVLTGELYPLMRQHHLDHQPLLGWLLGIGGILALAVLLTLLLIIF